MADQYLTQTQAAIYSSTLAALSEPVANAYLQAASSQVDWFCGRTFDTVLEELPPDVSLAVALWAEELTNGVNANRDIQSEKIGDYSVSYEASGAAVSVAYPCPMTVATLLAPYRIVPIG
jgi:hypothetical protein